MQINTLALAAGRALQKNQTKMVHFCKESEDLITHDTIPVYENALFALALFRSRLADHVLEGKALIEKLLAFEVEADFPVYLHDYPNIHDPYLGLRLLPIFYWLTIDFGHVLGELKGDLLGLIDRIILKAENRELPAWAVSRIQAMRGERFPFPENLDEGLISLQIAEKKGAQVGDLLQQMLKYWHPSLHLYVGPSIQRHQWGYTPEVTLYDLYMSSWQKHFSSRVSQPHPIHLKGALIRPLSFEPVFETYKEPFVHFDREEEMPLWITWGDGHTLALAKKHLKVEGSSDEMLLHVTDHDEIGISFYLDHHLDHRFFVNGRKASVFRQNDTLEIKSCGTIFRFSFTSEDGTYVGHLMRGNRPSQHLCRGEQLYASYDWRIAIRTVSLGNAPIRVKLQMERDKVSPPPLPLHASHYQHTE